MKSLVLAFIVTLSANAFASFNEVECEVKKDFGSLFLEIEQPFPTGSSYRNATLSFTDVNGDSRDFNYFVSARGSFGFYRLNYFGSGLSLEIDLWPDNRPQWGRNYRSTLRATDIQNPEIQNVVCTFPNAF